MIKPQLENTDSIRSVLSAFGGYDHRLSIGEEAFYEEQNLSSDVSPVFSPRHKRGVFDVSGKDLCMLFAKKKLCYLKNGLLYYGGEAVKGLSFPSISADRQCVSLGSKLLIFPDKVYVNTNDLTDFGSLDASFATAEGIGVTFSLCRGDGTDYDTFLTAAVAPESTANGALWLDTSSDPNELKQYSSYTSSWVGIPSTYVKIMSPGIGKNFKQYDGVRISGAFDESLNAAFVLYGCGDDFVIVSALIDKVFTQTAPILLERKMPDMDFFCEKENRVWGCSSEKNEIYASKLGDPTNWNCFMGISTDSYAVSVGTDGDFTGAIGYRGSVLFFKENCIHKIYGTNPPFSVTNSFVRGVQKGSEKSLVIVNETLYYKSPNGICQYDGGLPVSISEPFGEDYYCDAVGGAFRDRYYICMRCGTKRSLFAFDEEKRVWHREDEIHITEFASHNSNLYFLAEHDGVKQLYVTDGESAYGDFTGELAGWHTEESVPFSAVTGLWGLSLPDAKYYSAVCLRLTAEKGARIEVAFEYDSSGEWEKKASLHVQKTGTVLLPFMTPRCDHLRLKLSGDGDVKLFSITRTIETGSVLHV